MSHSPTQETPIYLTNREALRQLEKQRNELTNVCYGLGLGSIAAGFFNSLWLGVGVTFLAASLARLQKVSQIYFSMRRLLDAFESRGVLITPQIDVPDNGSLDLFIRFPNPPKVNFAIGLRSNGESTVYYNEAKENLYRRNKSGGLKPWQVDLFQRIGLQEFWLRKNRQVLFGQSSKDKNRVVAKVLVLTGETKLGKHPEHLYTTIGDQKVVVIKKRVSVQIMEESQLIPFIEAWLAQSQ
jgi:hypothetical protein